MNVNVQELDGNSDDEDEQMPNGDISSNLREDDDDLRDPVNVTVSKLQLVDLAGSEKSNLTGTTG